MQTAVEYLINYFSTYVDMSKHDIEIQQAKEMEKQQKKEEYLRGYKEGIESGLTYYPD